MTDTLNGDCYPRIFSIVYRYKKPLFHLKSYLGCLYIYIKLKLLIFTIFEFILRLVSFLGKMSKMSGSYTQGIKKVK